MAILPQGTPALAPDTNYSDSPLVTVSLACHSGDLHYLPRSVHSIAAQDLDLNQIQVFIVFDGDPTEEEEQKISEAIKGCDFQSTILLGTGKKTGYYCLGRNQAINHPYNFGLYQANLDADNEWKPDHLTGLLAALRIPDPDRGWPHFVYSRREYVIDKEAEGMDAPTGPSDLYEWTEENLAKLIQSPRGNFLDTGDFLIGKGTLYELAERTGCIWNTNVRRFGDWDLAARLHFGGFRGQAVDQVTHVYHWVGSNLQMTRKTQDFAVLPLEQYRSLRARGAFRE